MILTADLHLTDSPKDEYRWQVFDFLRDAYDRYRKDIYILGDLCDRKDRHSGELVNRLVKELTAFAGGPEIHIIMGNHDAPLKGLPFWSFFEHIKGVNFYAEPAAVDGLLLLPFTPNPAEAWTDLDFSEYRCLMLHQPLEGARGANGRQLAKGSPMPEFPKGMPIYAGDIHGPQKVGRVQYVGSPHPVSFDEDHPFRFLLLDDQYEIEREITLFPMRRHIIDLRDTEEPKGIAKGDQVKIRTHLPLADIGQWPFRKANLEAWAAQSGVQIVSLEPIIEAGEADTETSLGDTAGEAPEAVLEAFAGKEGIKDGVLKMGRRLLAQAMQKGS